MLLKYIKHTIIRVGPGVSPSAPLADTVQPATFAAEVTNLCGVVMW